MGKRILAFSLPILLLLFLIFYTNSNRTQHEEAFDGVQSDFRTELENAELEPTRDNDIYIYRDLETDYYGLYNSAIKQKITEPIYENISGMGDNGLMAATMDGYCGYIDRDGDVVIDFQYDEAKPFYEYIVSGSRDTDEPRESKFVAAVNLDGGYGAIDDSNSMLIHFAYDDIKLEDYVAIVYEKDSFSGSLLCGVSSYSDNLIIDVDYSSIRFYQKALFAEQTGTSGIYDIFKYSGEPRLTPDDIETLTPYLCDRVLGIMKCPGDLLAVHCTAKNYIEYWILLKDFQPVSNQCFEEISSYNEYDLHGKVSAGDWDEHNQENYTTAYAGTFYEITYAYGTGHYWDWDEDSLQWVVLDEQGNQYGELPNAVMDDAETIYTGANAYYAFYFGKTGPYINSKEYHGLVDIKTGNFTEYKAVAPVPDTNCIIVQDIKTELFGIIDGDHMVRECAYTDAEWGFDSHNMYVDLTRGGLQETYYAGTE